MKFEDFVKGFADLLDHFRVPRTDRVVKIYYSQLAHLSFEQWEFTVDWAICSLKFFPTVEELLLFADPSASQKNNIDVVWRDLIKKSGQLSSVRYDLYAFRRLDRELKAELNPEILLFLQENNISLLGLGDRTDKDLQYLKKMLKPYLHHNSTNNLVIFPRSLDHGDDSIEVNQN
jgi:hypothetical protein